MFMKRSSIFGEYRSPLRNDERFQESDTPSGPIRFLNPTKHCLIHAPHHPPEEGREGTIPSESLTFRWSSRNNRKGRHQLEYTPAHEPKQEATYLCPKSTASPRQVLTVIIRMVTNYPVWDISWLVAYIFTLGSIVWVINAFFVWLPLQIPSTEFPNEIESAGGITAFIGATIFEFGSILIFLEAVNEHQEECFGWAIHQIGHGSKQQFKLDVEPGSCKHHHRNRRNIVGKAETPYDHPSDGESNGNEGPSSPSPAKSWVWFPSLHALRTHYIHEIGFLACTAQLIGASIFWISGFTALPGINNILSPAALKGAYLAPQVLGGTGFIVSGVLFMLETQDKWYVPAFGTLGWHIGLWNLIGGWGFTLCPIFGYDSSSWAVYQESLSTFWGSWAFLVASLIQLYESLQKNPVDTKSHD